MDNEVVNVLLIDDDAAYAKIAEHLLTRFQESKFHLIWKKDGAAGVEEIKSNPAINVVLMDYFLPDGTGLELARQVVELNIEVPIIFLTTHKNFQVAVEAIKYGVYDYLVKDQASDAVLPRTILGVLNQARLRKQADDIEKQQVLAKKRAEAIQELIVTICHEFNNPLAAIKISTDIISRQQLTHEQRGLLNQFLQKLAILEHEVKKLRDIHWGMDAAKKE